MTQESPATSAPPVSSVAPAAPPAGPVASDSTATVGAALRRLRTARGWSLEEVSSRIKFSPRMIQALEEERWNDLPSGMPLRGLIRNYARLLDADGDAIAAMVDASSSKAPAAVNAAPHRPLGSTAGIGVAIEEDRGAGASWGWILVILVVLVIAVIYAFNQGWLPKEWLSFL